MKLKSLKLAGFKSFVDATTIPFRSQLNAVVGPNGCGKSNIVDAIRWVIGETSAKQLRGQSMSDVIFNGTTARKPVGKASIEMVFDNEDKRLLGEYAAFSEIAVRREVTREGQSTYLINGTACRRKDILDIFLGTGLGPRSYSIIEQGMVSRLVEAKPEDMRVHIEEASGISKYKERRRETENRIRRTHENLERLNDLREELDKQLRHLKRQANSAERYQEYKTEETTLRAQIKGLQWQALQAKLAEHNERLRTEETRIEAQLARQRELESEIEKAREQQVTLSEAHEEKQKAYYGQGTTISQLEQNIQSHQAQTARWQQELEEATQRWEELSETTLAYQTQIDSLESSLEALTPESSTVSVVAEEAMHALTVAEVNMKTAQSNWEQIQSTYAHISQEIEVARVTHDNLVAQQARLTTQRERLAAREEAAQLTALQDALVPLEAQVHDLEASITQIQSTLTALSEKMQTQRQDNQTNAQQIDTLRETLQAAQSEWASLDALQKSALGYDDAACQTWLAEQSLQDNTRLGQSLTVDSGWELAVETVLQGCFDAICVDALDAYAEKMSSISAGKLTLLDQASAKGMSTSRRETLLDKVQSEWPLDAWLASVYVASTFEAANALRAELAANESVILPNGLWMGPNWIRLAKAVNPEESILLRAQSLETLSIEIEVQQKALSERLEKQAQGEARLTELEAQRDAELAAYQTATQSLTHAKAEYSAQLSRVKALAQQQREVQEEMEECVYQAEQIQTAMAQQAEKLARLQASKAEQATQREQFDQARQTCQVALDEARARAQKEQQKADELDIRISSNESQLNVLKQTIERDARQLTQLSERRALLNEQLQDTDEPLHELKAQLQTELEAQATLAQAMRTAKETLSAHAQHLDALNRGRDEAIELHAAIQNAVQDLRMARQEVAVRQQTIQEDIMQSKQSLEAILADLPEEADLSEWEMRAETVASKIARLGPINLAAIDEYAATEERKIYLDQQHDDLVEALSVLDNAIQKIDRETKVRFQETFEKVNSGFQRLFPKIFGGGQASLSLTEDDILSAGIMVKAQPPGKRNATIHMLSGGEKALTAIALVFAMFELNPAPFCILDEVDAPLDDLNVGRFCQLVKEMSAYTQFIVISHNKVTIEAADHLMGVTMQEPGVSRVVSVDMEEAIEMVEAA